MYILDTDHISVMESASTSAEGQRLRFRLASLRAKERITTIITFEEQVRGWMSYLSQARSVAKEGGAYRRLKGVLDRYLKVSASVARRRLDPVTPQLSSLLINPFNT